MKSKYLRDIDCETLRSNYEDEERFQKEIEKYGIASYETWNLDLSFIEFIYISFMMYNEKNCIDTHFHELDINEEKWDMQEAIDYIIDVSKTYLIQRRKNFHDYEPIPHKFYEVLENVMPYMWW